MTPSQAPPNGLLSDPGPSKPKNSDENEAFIVFVCSSALQFVYNYLPCYGNIKLICTKQFDSTKQTINMTVAQQRAGTSNP